MRVLNTIAELRAARRALPIAPEETLGLVPTMGALHEGHLSLVRAAKRACSHVAVTIFVNPAQFGPNEDLATYPRTLEADCALLAAEGVDLVFAPSAAEMYPAGKVHTFVDPGDLGTRLDGQSRPGHFRGVATIVAKLFNLVQPEKAFFGQKDGAQVAVIRAIVRDLDLPVEIVVCPTARDGDGLALSSRNRFLEPEQRTEALRLAQALRCAAGAIQEGVLDPALLVQRMQHHLTSANLRIDYVAVVDSDTLLPQPRVDQRSLLAVAAWLGDVRLIDNLPVHDVLGGTAS